MSIQLPSLLNRMQQKVREADFFLGKMKDLENIGTYSVMEDIDEFRYYTSAFLNSIRNPLQYLHKDLTIAGNDAGLQWYNAQMVPNSTLAFLRDERNSNIHYISATPIANILVRIEEPANTSSTQFHHSWDNFPGFHKEVTRIGFDGITEIQQIIIDGRTLGYII